MKLSSNTRAAQTGLVSSGLLCAVKVPYRPGRSSNEPPPSPGRNQPEYSPDSTRGQHRPITPIKSTRWMHSHGWRANAPCSRQPIARRHAVDPTHTTIGRGTLRPRREVRPPRHRTRNAHGAATASTTKTRTSHPALTGWDVRGEVILEVNRAAKHHSAVGRQVERHDSAPCIPGQGDEEPLTPNCELRPNLRVWPQY